MRLTQPGDMISGGTGTFLALAIDPVTPSTVYGGDVQILKNVDGVANWQRVTAGIPNQAINALAIDPTTTLSTLYAGTQYGIFKSTDAGVTATAANTGLATLKVLALAVDPSAPSTVYFGTNLGASTAARVGPKSPSART